MVREPFSPNGIKARDPPILRHFQEDPMGSPIVGDQLYGEEGKIMLHKGLFLVATSLNFKHPITEDLVVVEIDLPNKFGSLMEREERRWNRFKLDNSQGN